MLKNLVRNAKKDDVEKEMWARRLIDLGFEDHLYTECIDVSKEQELRCIYSHSRCCPLPKLELEDCMSTQHPQKQGTGSQANHSGILPLNIPSLLEGVRY